MLGYVGVISTTHKDIWTATAIFFIKCDDLDASGRDPETYACCAWRHKWHMAFALANTEGVHPSKRWSTYWRAESVGKR
jgi:hypothetical protein